jgi:uncharacterized glyoxalase superfamily protein PhnB
MHKIIPMLCVTDVAQTVEWYESLGFVLQQRHPDTGDLEFAFLTHGDAAVMVQPRGDRPQNRIALWLYTGAVTDLYARVQEKRLPARLLEDLYDPFYGGRQFSVTDTNGFEIVFYDPPAA